MVLLRIILALLLATNFTYASDNILSKLRCITCGGQSIQESESEFARKIRLEISELKQKHSEEEILEIMRQKYGDSIVFEPKLNLSNIFIWLVPFILLLLGVKFYFKQIRQA